MHILRYSLSFSLSSFPDDPERDGWGGGPTRAKVTTSPGPDLESDEEAEAAKTGLDFWAGITVEVQNRRIAREKKCQFRVLKK